MNTTTYPTIRWGKETFLPLALTESTCEFNWTMQPGGAVPEHYHQASNEIFEILEGELTFNIAGQTFLKKAGEIMTVASMTPHSLHNRSKQPVQCRVSFTPAADQSKFFQVLIFLKGEGFEDMGALFRAMYICDQLGYREFSTMKDGMKAFMSLIMGCFRLFAPPRQWEKLVKKYVQMEVKPNFLMKA
ncbi:MAG: cupin domain-containing protein [Saprospiraceae bacterium]|nr:cupin domain-containing protein [Saprospiraceae bacterium]MCF8249237.1 cupin domain-containing protein [Saprospiraceae bacterium]MCF8280156.1 cupin domain-containing protein [Bacteroidales bacterium]MCF8311366.1 cupin domain-containing protein [Saprospiraceae bacterium]MCF8442987.1 cupin domain-containing protein [Saprospiraceae bacterium]